MIFHEVMALHEHRPILLLPTVRRHPENENNTKPLLSHTHVCRYWRDVAIGTPALWTRVHGRHLDQMDAFLQRSRPLAVTLFLDGQHQGGKWIGPLPECMESVVRAHSSRLRRLDLSILPTWHNVVPLLASLPAPQLECLTIMSPLAGSLLRDIVSWTPLLDEASSLRAFGLLPVADWLPSSTFPHLTHLLLYFDPETEELLHPFDLLRLLSNTPAVEFVHVDLFVYKEPYIGSWKPPSDPIPLPRLRSLVLSHCPYKILSTILPRLSLPEDTFIRLQDITNNFPVEGPVTPLPPFSIHPVTFLDVLMQGEELLMVADGPSSGLWLQARLDLYGFPDHQDWGGWLLSLHESLTLSHVTHLHIFIEGWETFWPAFLAGLPQLTHLAALLGDSSDEPNDVTGAYDSPTTTLCEALCGQDTPVVCPVLSTLTIEWPRETTQEDVCSRPRLLEMLHARSRAGHPIHQVVVQVPSGPPLFEIRPGQGYAPVLLTFFEMHELAGTACPPGTEYEVVEKAETGDRGLCAFEMREVWKVDGADRYWEVGEREKPHYELSNLEW